MPFLCFGDNQCHRRVKMVSHLFAHFFNVEKIEKGRDSADNSIAKIPPQVMFVKNKNKPEFFGCTQGQF
jgi:hypothetical protein